MTQADKDTIERLLKLKVASHPDKSEAQRLVNSYVNPGVKYCMTCAPSVRAMFKLLRSWWEKQNKNNWTFIKPIEKTKR
jgi:hypothetical protein